jgi:hypothetical protein
MYNDKEICKISYIYQYVIVIKYSIMSRCCVVVDYTYTLIPLYERDILPESHKNEFSINLRSVIGGMVT